MKTTIVGLLIYFLKPEVVATIIDTKSPSVECIYNDAAIWKLLSSYFANTTSITITIIDAKDAVTIVEDFLITFAKVNTQNTVELHVHFAKRRKGTLESNSGHILLVTNRKNFKNIFRNKLIFEKRTPLFIFYFIRNQSCSDIEKDISKILWNSWEHYILNLLINTPCSCANKEIVTFDPLDYNGSWGIIKRFTLEFLVKNPKNMVSDLRNFRGYPIRVTMFERNPTAIKELDYLNHVQENLTVSGGYGGLDGLTLQNMATYLNFTPIIFEPIGDDFGEKLINNTFTGSLGDIVYKRADFSANARFVKLYKTDSIEFTTIVSYEILCLIVPKSRRIPQWMMIFHSFSTDTWLLILASFLLVTLVWYLLEHFQSHYIRMHSQKDDCSFLVILTSMFLVPQRVHTRSSSKKILLAACMLLNVILMGIFQGSLATAFSVTSYYDDVNTIKQFLNTDLLISTSLADMFNNSRSNTHEELRKRLITPSIPGTSLYRAAYNRDVAAVERKSDADFLLQTKFLRSDGYPLLHVLEQCPNSYPLGYIVPRGFPFLEKFNSAIAKFFQAGLLDKWYQDFINNIIIKKKYELNLISSAIPSALDLNDIQAAFYLLFFGYITSITIFICERLLHKHKIFRYRAYIRQNK